MACGLIADGKGSVDEVGKGNRGRGRQKVRVDVHGLVVDVRQRLERLHERS